MNETLRTKFNMWLYFKYGQIHNYGLQFKSWALSFSLTYANFSLQVGPIRLAIYWLEVY